MNNIKEMTMEEIKKALGYDFKLVTEHSKGHWIPKKDNKAECSKCGILHLIAQYPSGNANFCPNCGAEMVGE